MLVCRRQGDIYHCHQAEYKRLYECHEKSDPVENSRNEVRHQVIKNSENDVVTHDVPAKTKCERDRAEDVRCNLNDHDEWSQPPNWAPKVFDVSEAVFFQTDKVVIKEHENPESESGVQVVSWRKNSWD